MLAMLGVPDRDAPGRGKLARSSGRGCAWHDRRSRAIPIGAAIGDQQSALFGQGAVEPGEAKSTYGTGAFLLMNTGTRRVAIAKPAAHDHRAGPDRRAGLCAGGVGLYRRRGDAMAARRHAAWSRRPPTAYAIARKSRTARSLLVPAFVGLGAPYWDSGASGAIIGITRGTTREDIVRAALDRSRTRSSTSCVAMESDTGERIRELRADGGAVSNPYLMQFQADLLARPVVLPKIAETTALGAAMLAGLAAGVWKSAASLDQLRQGGKVYRPKMRGDEREHLLAGWHAAVSRVLTRR